MTIDKSLKVQRGLIRYPDGEGGPARPAAVAAFNDQVAEPIRPVARQRAIHDEPVIRPLRLHLDLRS